MGSQVEISVVDGVELDAASCLVFNFKGGGAESVCKKDALFQPNLYFSFLLRGTRLQFALFQIVYRTKTLECIRMTHI